MVTIQEAAERLDLISHEVVGFPIAGTVDDMLYALTEEARNIMEYPEDWRPYDVEAAKTWLRAPDPIKADIAAKLVEEWDKKSKEMMRYLQEIETDHDDFWAEV